MAGVPIEPAKKRGIDDIIEHMTADLQSYEGQYILLGSPPPAGGSVWPEYSPPPPESVYYPQPVQRETDVLRMVDVGGGNFVNVVFNPGGQEYQQPVGFIHYPAANIVQPHIIDYSQRASYPENISNGCLIENVVGNWVPNRNGTYSPFGGQQEEQPLQERQGQSQAKKRIVAEVKPMRPSYSDVLAKPPLTPPPVTKFFSKPTTSPPIKPEVKKPPNKTSGNAKPGGGSTCGLKRQSSSGSEETLVEKPRATVKRWSSQEEVATSKGGQPVEPKREKKRKKVKPAEKDDKVADGVQNDSKTAGRKESPGMSVGPARAPDRQTAKPKAREERKGSAPKSERNSSNCRAPKTKRTQRSFRKRDTNLGALFKKWQEKSSYYLMFFTSWLINLLWSVTSLSTSLLIHMFSEACAKSSTWLGEFQQSSFSFAKRWLYWGKKERQFPKKPPEPQIPGSLNHNISLPTTGEEAMKRLLSCKGKDPYSILGVTSSCTDEEIKKYYKSQALLVHPDKNSQPGAEEAFKILVHAFDLIAEPERRKAYDRYVAETNQVEQAWSELSNLLSQLHEKMEYAANTIRCNNCGKRHKRELTDRPSYAARYCAQCKIHHSARESDMWAESRGWGWWRCRYYACMDGAVYDITQWANCQGNAIQRVKPDSHEVQYRVLLGRDNQPPRTAQGAAQRKNPKRTNKKKDRPD
ncbi:uncharacterized protein LOC106670838 isoform X2 [Cimex lectularius]|uniref:J domain-containing protein n=1 Tax=Cimex lectularius TaxID=79782 RepID=A0A8I6SU41_CIMLE|nr:uncharacterized protein LOC106670838 isoform X2 [Cimex lectularius]